MAETRTPQGTRPPAHRWPRLRADLRLVHDNPVTGRGQVRVIDPRTGRQFAFTERENLMLQAADGQTDVDTLAARLAATLEGGTRPGEVTEFFRRLKILGLLDTSHLAALTALATEPASAVPVPEPGPEPAAAPEGDTDVRPTSLAETLPPPKAVPAGPAVLRGLAGRTSSRPATPRSAPSGLAPSGVVQSRSSLARSTPANSALLGAVAARAVAPQMPPETITRLDQLRPRHEAGDASSATVPNSLADTPATDLVPDGVPGESLSVVTTADPSPAAVSDPVPAPDTPPPLPETAPESALGPATEPRGLARSGRGPSVLQLPLRQPSDTSRAASAPGRRRPLPSPPRGRRRQPRPVTTSSTQALILFPAIPAPPTIRGPVPRLDPVSWRAPDRGSGPGCAVAWAAAWQAARAT